MAALTLLAVGFFAYRVRTLATVAADAREEATLSREAETLSTFVGGWVDAQARTLQGWHRVWDMESRDAAYRLGLARAVYQAMDAVVTVAWVDERGAPVVRPQFLSGADVPPGRVPGSADRADEMLAHLPPVSLDGVAIGRPYLAPGAGEPSVVILAGEPGDPVRLAAEVSLHVVERTLMASQETAVVLLDDWQTPFAGDAGLLDAIGGLRDVVGLGPSVSFQVDEGPIPVRGATVQVPFLPWTLAVLRPEHASEGIGAAIRDEGVRVALVFMVVVLGIGLVLDRTITRSVRDLTRHVRRIRDGDYQARSEIQRSDELGELARAFDEMAVRLEQSHQSLQAAYDELAGFNEALQRRVAQRTEELEQAQQRLLQAAQVEVVAEVGAGLAHELNNPLAVLLGQIDLSQARAGANPEALDRMRRAAERCREVVATMRSLVAGEVERSSHPVVDLRGLTQEVVTALRERMQRRDVRIDDRLGSDPLWVRAEPAVLRQALTSFFTVLAKSAAQGMRVTLRPRSGGMAIETDPPLSGERAEDDLRAGAVRLWRARRMAQLAGLTLAPEGRDGRVWSLRAEGEA